MLILAGLAGWQWKVALDAELVATEQRRIAEQQSLIARSEATRAERNFGAAKDTINSVISIWSKACNTQWQIDLVQALAKLAVAGDDPVARWGEALAILKRLEAEGRLTPAQQKWIAQVEAALAKLAQGSVQ